MNTSIPAEAASIMETFPQTAVCGNPAADDDAGRRSHRRSPQGLFHQDITDRLLIRRRQIGQLIRGKRGTPLLEPCEEGGLQTAETEIQTFPHRPRKWKCLAVALFREAVDHHPSRIADVQQFCRLVEGLSRRIVPGLTEYR